MEILLLYVNKNFIETTYFTFPEVISVFNLPAFFVSNSFKSDFFVMTNLDFNFPCDYRR